VVIVEPDGKEGIVENTPVVDDILHEVGALVRYEVA